MRIETETPKHILVGLVPAQGMEKPYVEVSRINIKNPITGDHCQRTRTLRVEFGNGFEQRIGQAINRLVKRCGMLPIKNGYLVINGKVDTSPLVPGESIFNPQTAVAV